MSVVMTAVLAAIAGLIVGAAITAWLVRRPGNPASPAALKQEMESYKEDVAEHFAQTAALVNKMTDSYKDVFDHLQGGASKLISEEVLRDKLADQSGEVITLNRLGAGGATAATAAEADTPTEVRAEEQGEAVTEQTPEAQAEASAESAESQINGQAGEPVLDHSTAESNRAGEATADEVTADEARDEATDEEPQQPPAAHS